MNRRSVQKPLLFHGTDRFGSWEALDNGGDPTDDDNVELCIASGPIGHTPRVLIVYPNLQLPPGIDAAHTIIRDEECLIGLDCGCYAKFHRQVAHIQDKMNQQHKKP